MLRNFFIIYIFFQLFIISIGTNIQLSHAQEEGKLFIVSEKVGTEIDLYERNKYQLFQKIEGFQSAVFLKLSNDTYMVKIVFYDNNEEKNKVLKDLTNNEIEKIQNHINNIAEIKNKTYDGVEESSDSINKNKENQPYALAVLLGYYAPSLQYVNELSGDEQESNFPAGPCVGYRIIVSKIPKVLILGEYYYWESIVRGTTDLYWINMKLRLQSANITGIYKIFTDYLAVGAGIGFYFTDYSDMDRYSEVIRHFKNETVGFHLCAGIFEGPNNKLFNFTLEGRYVFATVKDTPEGFPKTELSGPKIIASIMF